MPRVMGCRRVPVVHMEELAHPLADYQFLVAVLDGRVEAAQQGRDHVASRFDRPGGPRSFMLLSAAAQGRVAPSAAQGLRLTVRNRRGRLQASAIWQDFQVRRKIQA